MMGSGQAEIEYSVMMCPTAFSRFCHREATTALTELKEALREKQQELSAVLHGQPASEGD